MATKEQIDPALLRQLLRYEPETGRLFWRERSPAMFKPGSRCSQSAQAKQWNALFAGQEAFATQGANGYLKGGLFGKTFLAHRIAYALHFAKWPDQIDHINGERADNRIENLRSVTCSQNNRNRRLPRSNTSGRIGVFWHEKDSCWRAQIKLAGRQIHLGSFKSKAAAIAARERAEIDAGNFHKNHGRRA